MILRLLQVAVAVAVVAAVVVSSHPEELWRLLQDVNTSQCAVALALNLPVLLLTPVRSGLVLHSAGFRVGGAVLVPSTILGFVAGGLTPAASGELLRAQALRSAANVPLQPGMTAVIYERVMSLYLLLVTTGLVMVSTMLPGPWVAIVAVVAIALCAAPWATTSIAGRLLPTEGQVRWSGRAGRLPRKLLHMAAQLRFLLADGRLITGFSAVTLAMFALIAAQYWFLAQAAGTSISVTDAWLAFGLSTFAGVLALIPLGLGVLDAALAAALDRLGTTIEQGGVIALLVRGVVTLPLVLAALGCYLYLHGRGLRAPAGAAATPFANDHSIE
jgi:uncharacterized protein (TIRG00374 family)